MEKVQVQLVAGGEIKVVDLLGKPTNEYTDYISHFEVGMNIVKNETNCTPTGMICCEGVDVDGEDDGASYAVLTKENLIFWFVGQDLESGNKRPELSHVDYGRIGNHVADGGVLALCPGLKIVACPRMKAAAKAVPSSPFIKGAMRRRAN